MAISLFSRNTAKSRKRLVAMLALVLVASGGGIVWLGMEARREIDALAVANSDSTQWSLAQSELELMALRYALVEVELDRTAALSDVRRRFDIFYSRVQTLSNARQFEPVRAEERAKGAITRVQDFLERSVPYIDGPNEALRDYLPNIYRETELLQPDLRLISMTGVEVFARASEARRQSVAAALWKLGGLSVALFVSLVLLVLELVVLLLRAREASDAIMRTQSRLNAVVATSFDAILVANRDGCIVEWNDAAERIFGFKRHEAMGRRLSDMIIPEEFRGAHEAGLRRYVETGERRVIGAGLIELQARRQNGEVFPVEFSISSANSGDEELFVSYLRDISDRVAAQDELVRTRDKALASEKAKAEFLAVMSHEMRTPLNGILGSLTLLQKSELNPKQRKFVDTMDISGRLLMEHVNSVLDISRVDAGKMEFARHTFDVGALVSETVHAQELDANSRGNTLRVSGVSSGNVMRLGDPGRVRQILVNLLGNAVKFTRDGEIVAWMDLSRADRIVLEIRDTGIGIAPEHLERIFEDFVTLDSSFSREVEGTGLGLGIVKRLVTGMGGKLHVESEPDAGTTFRVVLPFEEVSQELLESKAEESPPPVDPSLSGARILLVEDNEINRMIAGEMLQSLGCELEIAHDGVQGVEKAAQAPFDLILMDISMPRLDGIEATKMIRDGNGPNKAAPVIALTAHALPDDIDKFKDAGMDDVVIKPLDPAHLEAVLHSQHGKALPTGGELRKPDLPVASHSARDILERAKSELEEGLALVEGMVVEEAAFEPMRKAVHKISGLAAIMGWSDLHASLRAAETAAIEEDMPALEDHIADARELADTAMRDA